MNSVIPYLIGLMIIGLLFFIQSRSTDPSKQYFQFTLISILLWTISIILTQLDPNQERVLWWSRLSFTFPLGMALFLHPFAYSLIDKSKNNQQSLKTQQSVSIIFYIIGGLFGLATFTPLILSSVHEYHSSFGPLQPFYSLFILSSFVWVGYCLAKAIKSNQAGEVKYQLMLVLAGISISAILAIIFNLVFPIIGLGEHRELGPASLIFFIGFSSYTIIAHHLFDIKVAIRRTIVYSILLFTLFGAYSLFILLFANILPFTASGEDGRYTNFLVALIIGFSFNPFKTWLQDRTDKFLYKKEYEQQSVLHDLSNQLNNVIGLDEALEIVMQTILKTFRISKAVTYIFQAGEHGSIGTKRIKHIGFTKEASLMLSERDFIIEYFCSSAQIVTLRQLKEHFAQEALRIQKDQSSKSGALNVEDLSFRIRANAKLDVVIRKLTSLGAEAAVPLHLGEQFIGLLLLSNKLSEDPFTNNDLQLLDLAGQAAISSIQKAKLYEGDQMKSEFVSIASHELLTPISAIEGYLSMILDENIGTVDEQARTYLTKVYTSSRRLSQLVKDLLSVSRIESGRMSITPQAVDMTKLIKETIEQLHFLAKNKGLELNYTAPTNTLPMVRADPDRVTQVLTNLVSNAIKYTPSGSVTIKANVTKSGDVRVAVSDTGLGMTRQSRSHLFEKFYRIATDETVGIIGTGLGLYITRSILEKMGGSISVESVPKSGSTFTITLPSFEAEAVVQYT